MVDDERDQLQFLVRNIADFPKKGIMFRDITTLLKDRKAFKIVIDLLAKKYESSRLDKIVGIESRGFIFASALAYRLGCGFVPIRKPNKLPSEKYRVEYELEYGSDALEIHVDALEEGDRVLLADDLLATGGTMVAACELVKRFHAEIIGIAFLIELSFLGGRTRLAEYEVHSLMTYETE